MRPPPPPRAPPRQVGAAAIAVASVALLGPGLLGRSAGMGLCIAFMMWGDCVHPPGGAPRACSAARGGGAPCIFLAHRRRATLPHHLQRSLKPPTPFPACAGALVVMAMDSAAIQSIQWYWLLYPSLAVSLAILLPCSALACWLKRAARFDWPAVAAAAAGADGGAGSGSRLKAA